MLEKKGMVEYITKKKNNKVLLTRPSEITRGHGQNFAHTNERHYNVSTPLLHFLEMPLVTNLAVVNSATIVHLIG